MMANKGDHLPVCVFPPDGTWPTGTTKWEKRNIARRSHLGHGRLHPVQSVCAGLPPCGHPSQGLRRRTPGEAPESFQSVDYKAPDFRGLKYTIQVAPEDCTGCNLCVEVCPAKRQGQPERKAINMEPQRDIGIASESNFTFFLDLPEIDRSRIQRFDAKGSQWLEPLFEYSGACAGCGETPTSSCSRSSLATAC